MPLPPLVVTPGEPGGIGVEIAVKAWRAARAGTRPFALIADQAHVHAVTGYPDCGAPVAVIDDIAEATDAFADALPVLAISYPVVPRPGVPDPANAPAVIEAIERAVGLVQKGRAAALVTNPIQKNTLHQGGFPHPGHTEFLAALAGNDATSVMMLATGSFRVVPLTIHVPIRAVPELITAASIERTVRITAAALRSDFGIDAPTIAVTGLNPHAGEAGSIGDEELRVIGPTLDRLRGEGFRLIGPEPADTLFHVEARGRYDAAVCMYHDQALIPLKTVDFWGGVNVTIGLPFVRTSPDHGTALGLAGTGSANAASLIAALDMAADIAARRAGSSVDR
jgi:4-hydroxythreonine-4-phosphate dehydrogenase